MNQNSTAWMLGEKGNIKNKLKKVLPDVDYEVYGDDDDEICCKGTAGPEQDLLWSTELPYNIALLPHYYQRTFTFQIQSETELPYNIAFFATLLPSHFHFLDLE